MRKLLTAVTLLLVLAATAANVNLSFKDSVKKKPSMAVDTVVIQNDSAFSDSLALSLKKIPNAQGLYSVAKKTLGKWAKLFVVIKIEESGADGKNSFYAKQYHNLTGMRYPGNARKTTAIRSGHNYYAVFRNWHDCMVDFGYYMEVMEANFVKYYNRAPADEYEMVNFMHGSYNVYMKWRNDVHWLLNHFNYK